MRQYEQLIRVTIALYRRGNQVSHDRSGSPTADGVMTETVLPITHLQKTLGASVEHWRLRKPHSRTSPPS